MKIHFIILPLVFVLPCTAAATSQKAMVIVQSADVWTRPLEPGEKPTDSLRDTQVLYGEQVLIHESSGPWIRIEIPDQPEFTHHNKWEGYPGWVSSSTVKVGSEIQDKSLLLAQLEGTPREKILKLAPQFIGDVYLWGGLTSAVPGGKKAPEKYGVDCSGLVHFVYRRSIGMVIPRDSFEQWMKAKPITRAELQPADLIFSAKVENPKKITHVAIYAGEGQIIEAPQTGMTVRKVSFQEKYGAPFDQVESGDIVGERVVYFGSFLH